MWGKKKKPETQEGVRADQKLTQQALLATSAAIAVAAPGAAEAATFNVSDQASFEAALAAMAADRSSDHTINITASFQMSAPVAPIVADADAVITIDGNGFEIDGAGQFRPFFIYSGEVNIADLVIDNASAQGGDGAGGGMGAGGGVFVNSLAVVSLTNVGFTNSSAIGGSGGQQYQGGGGGLGGDGGAEQGGGGGGLYGDGGAGSEESGGGGGGALGDGGASSTPTDYGGGGGGGFFGDGGQGRGHELFGAGGGGGGFTADGTDGGPGQSVPGQGGGAEGGDGSAAGVNAEDGQAFGGGGGGAGPDAGGGDGAFGGGGGGSGGTTDLNLDPSQDVGGQGGVFGGGGGGEEGGGGAGGDFGGGGGIDTGGATQFAGDGGYGGGGGGADPDSGGAQGGAGGFGGGRGFGAGGGVGDTGYGGGDATVTGGGGAGFGGAIFVRDGGTLIIREGVTLSGGSVAGGAGVNGGGSGSSAGEGIFIQSGDLTFDIGASGTTTISDEIADAVGNGSDAGALVKTGAGTLVLETANTYTGGTTINAGTVRIETNASFGTGAVTLGPGTIDFAGGLTSAYAITLAGNGGLNVDTGSVTQSGNIGETGGSFGLDKTGAGTLRLSGTNTFTGATNVNAGTLQLQNGDALSDVSAVTVASGATLQLINSEIIGSLAGGGNVALGAAQLGAGGDNSSTVFSGVISGTGDFTKYGTGTLTLSGTNTYTGATNVVAGTLLLSGGSAIGDANVVGVSAGAILALDDDETIGSVAGAGNIDLDDNTLTTGGNAGSTTFSGIMSGSGGLVKVGAGTFTLTGANTYTGATNVNVGTLEVSGGQAIADTSAVTVASGATLLLSGSEEIGSLAGAGNVNLGANTLTAGADNTSTTFSGIISGAGALVKEGTNVLTLSGANTFGGGTTIAGGTIRVENNSAFGTGAVTTTGSTIDYGDGITIANAIVLMSDPTLNVDVGAATQSGDISESGGSHGITKTGLGNLILSGTNTFTGATIVNAGTLTLNGGAALSNVSAVTVAASAALALGASEEVGSIAGDGTISLGANTLTAGGDGASTIFNGAITGTGGLTKEGAGTLTLGGTNTYAGATNVNAGGLTLSGGSAIADAGVVNLAAGTLLTLDDDEVIGSLDGAGDVNLSGNTLTTGGNGATTALSGAISGTGGLTKDGAGVFTLSGANTYTGATNVNAGTLALSGGSALSNVSAVTVALGATLQLNASEEIGSLAGAGNVSLGVNTLTAGGDNSSTTFAGIISGSGGLAKAGSGTLELSGANAYTGATNIAAGILALTGGAALDDANAVTIASGATLQLNDSEEVGSVDGAGAINLGANTLTTGGDGASTTLSGAISGLGGLTKEGTGTFTLSGVNTFTGATNVNAGVLALNGGASLSDVSALTIASGASVQLGDDEEVGSIAGGGDIQLGANTLTAGGDGSTTSFSGIISGSGGFTKAGAGALTLSGANTFTGATNVNAGTLSLAGGAAINDSGAVNIASGATLALLADETVGSVNGAGDISLGGTLTAGGNNASTTVSGIISGAGGLIKSGTGALTLSGLNTYAGGTTIAGGTIRVETNSAFGTGAVTTTGSTIDYADGVTIANAIVLMSNPNLNVDTGSATQSGGISESGGAYGINKTGAGELVLSGINTFTGASSVSAGTLTISGGSSLSDIASLNVLAGATLQLQSSETIGSLTGVGNVNLNANTLTAGGDGSSTLFSGAISGTGNLDKAGGGALTLSGANTFTGETNVNAGTLILSGGAALSDVSAVTVAGGAALQLNASEVIGSLAGAGNVDIGVNTLTAGGNGGATTFSGIISGSGGFTKEGAGTLTLSGANTYTGATNVTGGGLTLSGGAAIADSSAVVLAAGTLLTLNDDEEVGSLDGAGDVNLNGNTLTTGGDNSSTTFSGAMSGTGGLTKAGTGTFTLAGANTFTGATNVNAGSLALSGGLALADASDVIVAGGATLQVDDAETIGSLSGAGNVSLAETLTTGFNSASTVFSGDISGAGGLTYIGTGVFTLSGTNTFTGATNVNAGELVLSGGSAIGDTNAVAVASGALITLTSSEEIGSLAGAGAVALGANTLTTGGDGSDTSFAGVISGSGGLVKVGAGAFTLAGANTFTGATNVSGGALELDGGSALADTSAVTVAAGAMLSLLDDETIGSLTGAGNLALNTNALTTGGDGSSTLFSGIISGSGGLIKEGVGTFTLSGANTFTGDVSINAGTLAVQGSQAIGDLATVNVALGAAFTLNNSETIGALMGAGDVNLGANTLTTGGNDASTTFSGIIDGAGGLVKAGAGTFTLTGANTFTGATQILGGVLEIAGGSALSDTAGVAIASGAVLSLLDDETIGSLSGGGNVLLGANTLTTGGDNASTVFSGVISGTGGLTKIGSGDFILTGNNTYTGATLVLGGTLTFSEEDALQDGAVVTIDAPALVSLLMNETVAGLFGNGSVDLGAFTLTVDDGADSAFAGVIFGSGGLTKDGAASFTLSGANTYTGATNVLGGTLVLQGGAALADVSAVTVAAGATLDVQASEAIGSLAGAGNMNLNSSTLSVGGANSTTIFSGVLSGTGGLTKVGTGAFTLSGANTYTGDTNVNGGTMILDGGNAIVDTNLINVGPFGTLQLDDSETIGGLNGAGLVALGGNVLTVGAGDTSSAFAGAIGGTGSLTKIGTGTFTLSGPNTFTGPTTVSNGTLALNGGAALSNLTAVTVNAPGLLALGASEIIGSLAGDGGVDLGAFFLGFGGDNSSTAFSGLISGTGGLVKFGAGAFTLSGANTFSGGVTIAGGTIRVENNAALGTGTVTTTGSTLDYADGVDIANAIELMSYPNLNVDVGSATQSGDIFETGGSFGIFKTGAGSLTLSGANTYTGATVVSAGTLVLTGGAAIANTGVVLVDTGAGLALTDDETIGDLTGDGDLDLSDDTLTIAGLGFYEFAGDISGTGGLALLAGGEMELSGDNTFSGGVQNDGLLVLFGANAAGTGAIVNNDDLLFNASLSNSVSGTGVIEKYGVGFAELTGTNTHSGGTIVGSGVLRAGLSAIGTGQLSIIGGATFELNQASNATIVNAIVGAPTSIFRQIGAGTITYNGGQFGDFFLQNGTANVMGAIGVFGANGFTVSSGATLTGTGLIVGDVTNAGLISPAGDSIGVLTIDGDYTHASTGRLRIQFDPGSNIDLLAVTGTATINGGVVELLSLGGADGTGLTFLTAAGGVSGAFSSLEAPSGGATGIIYNANAIEISPTIATARPSTPNSQLALTMQTADEVLTNIADELEQDGDPGVWWGRSLFGELDRDAAGASRGFNYSSRGGMGGMRTPRTAEGLAFGIGFSQTEGEANLEEGAGHTDIEGGSFAFYGDWRSADGLTIAGGVTIGKHEYETRRRVLLNNTPIDLFGESDADTYGVYVGVAQTFDAAGWRTTISGRANYLSTDVHGYEESGSNVLRVRLDGFDAETLVSRVRLNTERRLQVSDAFAITPSVSIGVTHEAALGNREVQGAFASSGLPILLKLDDSARTMGEGRLGLTFDVGESFEIGAHAAYISGDDQDGHYGAVSARWRF